jgi:hypothetical protein
MDVTASDSSISGIPQFSTSFLNLQDNFCCWNADGRNIVRWVGCNPSIYKNGKSIFQVNELAFCNWFQIVDTYQFTLFSMDPEGLVEANLNSKYVLIRATWPTGTTGPLESQKVLEVQIPQQNGYVGSLIPFNVGGTSTPDTYNTMIFKDVFHINTESLLDGTLTINNPSAFPVDVAVLYAK